MSVPRHVIWTDGHGHDGHCPECLYGGRGHRITCPQLGREKYVRELRVEVRGMWETTFPPWRWPAYFRHWRNVRELKRKLKQLGDPPA